jgi:murein DD-endopeptidase MepM/ murein hydrolase activator NlpD
VRRMRSNNRVFSALALCVAAAVGAAPALAAQGAGPPDSGRPVEPRFGLVKVADWAGETGRRQRARLARLDGPFLPIVGNIDYGSAEAAFGAARSGHVHAGQDMFAPAGTPLVAATDAVVADVGSDGGQGNYVHLYDRDADRTYVYMHMIEPAKVGVGERVRAGQLVGGVGCTGSCWGDHLHFEVREGKGFTAEARDPLPLLKGWRSLSKPL